MVLPSLRVMAKTAKVSISSLVVVGVKEIIRSGKLYDESVDLPVVITRCESSVILILRHKREQSTTNTTEHSL